MTSNAHEKKIIKVLESCKEDYLDELMSDLEQYEKELLQYIDMPYQKFRNHQFDDIAKNFGNHKINIVKEEIDILENLDITILEHLAYIFDSYRFSFLKPRIKPNKESPTYILTWFIDRFMSAPIFNAIVLFEKLKRRNINWVNYKRDLRNFETQIKKGLHLVEGSHFFAPVLTEDEILRIFFTKMYTMYLNPQQEAIMQIVSCISPGDRKRMPKEQEAHIRKILTESGLIQYPWSHPQPLL